MEKMEILGKQPRRKFFASLLSGIAGVTALLALPRRARAEAKKAETPEAGPILYRRTEETERYYRTLYR
jgi:hypothetical protein